MNLWYNKESLANILSLVAARKLYSVTMDITEELVMYVHVTVNDNTTSIEIPIGLYYHDNDFPNYCTYTLSNHVSIYNFLNTVSSKLKL